MDGNFRYWHAIARYLAGTGDNSIRVLDIRAAPASQPVKKKGESKGGMEGKAKASEIEVFASKQTRNTACVGVTVYRGLYDINSNINPNHNRWSHVTCATRNPQQPSISSLQT